MFKEQRARIRADSVIEEEAENIRAKCELTTCPNFSLTEVIEEHLANRAAIRFELVKYPNGTKDVPAYVSFSGTNNLRTLNVEQMIWNRAAKGFSQERFILSHEIGHLALHSHAELAFCEGLPELLDDLQDQEKAEYQANLFADCFLVPERMLLGFVDPTEIAEHFNVPIKCAVRRLFTLNDRKRRANARINGNFCPKCMNFSLIEDQHKPRCQTFGCA